MKKNKKVSFDELTVSLSLEEYNTLLEERSSLEKEHATLQEKQHILSEEYRTLSKEHDSLLFEKASMEEQIVLLTAELEQYKRRLWGASSEKIRLPENPEELDICLESPIDVDGVKELAKTTEKAKKEEQEYSRFRKKASDKKHSHARKPIAKEHERKETVLDPDVDLTGAVLLDSEVTEKWGIKTLKLYVIRIVRNRYKLPDGRIVIAPMPVQAYPRSNASESVLAHIAVAKYADHLPLHRQIEIFSREGVHLSPSTVSNWMSATAQRIEPIYNELREKIRSAYYVQADETPHKVLESEKPGALHQGYMWNYYLPEAKTPFFVYHPGRGKYGANLLLNCGAKAVQTDGYGVYEVFDDLPGYHHLGCWAHTRRKFVESKSYDPHRAGEALQKIRQLYAIEENIKELGLEDEAIVRLRKKESYPIIRELELWAKENREQVLCKSPISKAIEYMYNRMEQLSIYVNDARFQIDTNAVERSIRPLTLNRKNTLFSGSHDAAHNAAIFFTLLGACKEHEVNPKKWLEDVIIKVQNCPADDYSTLLPWNWKADNETR